jgi:lipopolysaccharide export system protein LptC
MAVARTQTFDQRTEILGRLVTRNRIVTLLRVVVPALGVVALLVLLGQIWLSNLARQYGVSGIRIDRGNLVVETPQYSEIGSDGTQYFVAARDARTPLNSPGEIEMADPKFTYVRPGRSPFHATALTGSVNTETHLVRAPGRVTVTTDEGLVGTMYELNADMRAQVTTAKGPVDITMPDGSHLTADDLHYQGSTNVWTFHNATLEVPDLPVRTVSWVNVFAVFSLHDGEPLR